LQYAWGIVLLVKGEREGGRVGVHHKFNDGLVYGVREPRIAAVYAEDCGTDAAHAINFAPWITADDQERRR